MNSIHRLDRIFIIGHSVTLLGFAVRGVAPEWFAGSLLQSFHLLCGVSIFSVFFLWSAFRLARVELDPQSRLLWFAALLVVSPITLPVIYVRFLRPGLAVTR